MFNEGAHFEYIVIKSKGATTFTLRHPFTMTAKDTFLFKLLDAKVEGMNIVIRHDKMEYHKVIGRVLNHFNIR